MSILATKTVYLADKTNRESKSSRIIPVIAECATNTGSEESLNLGTYDLIVLLFSQSGTRSSIANPTVKNGNRWTFRLRELQCEALRSTLGSE